MKEQEFGGKDSELCEFGRIWELGIGAKKNSEVEIADRDLIFRNSETEFGKRIWESGGRKQGVKHQRSHRELLQTVENRFCIAAVVL